MPSSPNPYSPTNGITEPSTMLSFSGLKTPQQQQRKLKNNMIGLSSLSYVKKSPSRDLPSISTSVSSPRISSSGCKSPFTAKRQQLPVFIRKQQQQQEVEEEDDREIIKNNGFHNTYGVPTNNPIKQSKKAVTQSDLNQKIRVCVRKRPLSKKEVEKCEKDITPAASVRTVHVNEPK